MRVALMTEPQQGLSYLEILAIARAAEAAGFEGFFRSDHFTSFPGPAGERTTDAWATLAGLARETSRIQLGALVSPVTFRIPGSFAKLVTTVDEMSGGRVEIGVGAGWNEEEHRELGIPYPTDAATRVDMLEEQLAILVGLLDEPDGWTFEGEHWQVRRTLFRPRYDGSEPRADGRRRPNIIVGGVGRPRSIRLAVRYADEYNVSSSTPAQVAEINARIDTACAEVGRDPTTLRRSVMAGVLVVGTKGVPGARRGTGRDVPGRPGPGGIVDGGPQGSLGRRDDGRGTHPHGRVRGGGRRPHHAPGLPARATSTTSRSWASSSRPDAARLAGPISRSGHQRIRPMRVGGQYRNHGAPTTVAGSTAPKTRESVECSGSSPARCNAPAGSTDSTRLMSSRSSRRGSGAMTSSPGAGGRWA